MLPLLARTRHIPSAMPFGQTRGSPCGCLQERCVACFHAALARPGMSGSWFASIACHFRSSRAGRATTVSQAWRRSILLCCRRGNPLIRPSAYSGRTDRVASSKRQGQADPVLTQTASRMKKILNKTIESKTADASDPISVLAAGRPLRGFTATSTSTVAARGAGRWSLRENA